MNLHYKREKGRFSL